MGVSAFVGYRLTMRGPCGAMPGGPEWGPELTPADPADLRDYLPPPRLFSGSLATFGRSAYGRRPFA